MNDLDHIPLVRMREVVTNRDALTTVELAHVSDCKQCLSTLRELLFGDAQEKCGPDGP
jgi:hypothetical protein